MQETLMRCYYENMTTNEAKKFIENSYNKKVSEKSIELAKSKIKSQLNKEWN